MEFLLSYGWSSSALNLSNLPLGLYPTNPVKTRTSKSSFRSSRLTSIGAVSLLIGILLPACSRSSSSQSNVAAPGTGGPPAQAVSVLFLGDDFTRLNDTPGLLEGLALAAGRSIDSEMNAPTGTTLGEPQTTGDPHSSNPTSLNLINSRSWDFVILQEEAATPTIPFAKNNFMLPGANTLSAVIQANDPATTVLMFETWASDVGGQFCHPQECSPFFADFDTMQDTVSDSCMEVATTIGADLAPIGQAWQFARQRNSSILLHEADGFTPTLAGSYLAACVIYTHIYQSSPVGLSFTGGLPSITATFLQDAAANAIWGPTCGLSDYGTEFGAQNTLTLNATGNTGPGGVVKLTPVGLDPSQKRTFIYTSYTPGAFQLPFGVLLVDLNHEIIPRRPVLNGKSWVITIPNDPSTTGFEAFFQVIADDPFLPGGILLSQGVRVQICP